MNTQYENCYKAALDFVVKSAELTNLYKTLEKLGKKDSDLSKSLSVQATRIEKEFLTLKHSLQKINIGNSTALDLAIKLDEIDKDYSKCAIKSTSPSTIEIESQVYIDSELSTLESNLFEIKEKLESHAFLYDYSWR